MALVGEDPFTSAIRAFFVSQVGPSIGNSGVSLNFSPLEPPVSASNFVDATGKYNQDLADIYFSINIADRPAHLSGNQHYVNMNTSLSAVLEGSVLNQAIFYPRGDLSESANQSNLKIFEKLLSKAQDGMIPSVAPSTTPFKYMQSLADPSKWSDATVSDIWKKYSKTLASEKAPTHVAAVANDNDLSFRLPWRRFDIEELKRLIEKMRSGIKPPLPFPQPHINELDDIPGWVKSLPSPMNATEIGNFGVRFLDNKQHGRLGASGLEATPQSFAKLKANQIDLKQMGIVQLKMGHEFAGLKSKPFNVGQLGAGFGGKGGFQQQMMMGEFGGEIGKSPDMSIRLEDFAVTGEADRMASWVLKSAALKNASTVEQTEAKDEVSVSFEYTIIRVHRPWLDNIMPLLGNSNWYIPGARRGELTLGKEGAVGILEVVAQSVIIVRNLSIKAKFSDADRDALGNAFALGPFTLDKSVNFQAGSLSWSGMQIIGYMDMSLPTIPPRSDPSFPA